MKLSLLSMLYLCLLLSTAGIANAQRWNTITDHDHHYTLQFPELPQEVFKNVPEGLKITTYASSEECTYMTKILVMNSEVKDGAAMANKTLNAMAKMLDGEVTAEEEWKYGESVGVKGQIDVPEKGEGKPQLKAQCNVIVVGKVQYQIVVMGSAELYQEAVAEHFFASFRFL